MKEQRTETGGHLGTSPIVLARKGIVRKYLGIGYLIAGIFFLFLPEIAILDLIPDFIGYFLIVCGLSELRDINDYFEEARSRFLKMGAFSFAKLLAFFLVMAMVLPQEKPDTLLLLAFVFAIFDFIFLLPAWNNLFEGFSYMHIRYGGDGFERWIEKNGDGESPTEGKRLFRTENGEQKGQKRKRRKKARAQRMRLSRTESVRRLTIVFFVLKTILTVLPEFSALTADTELNVSVKLYDYIGLLRAAAMLPILALGIVWVIRTCAYLRAIRRDSGFIAYGRDYYRENVLTKEHLFTHRHLQTALFFAAAAMLFRADFRLNALNVVPDAIFAVLLIVAVICLGEHVGRKRYMIGFGIAFSLASLGMTAYEFLFYENYRIASIMNDEGAYTAYTWMVMGKVVEEMLFVATVVLFLALLRHVIRNYTGFSVSFKETGTPSEKIRLLHLELEGKLKWIFILAILSAIAEVLTVALALEMRPGLYLDWFSLLDTAIAVFFSFFCIKTVREIYTQVEYRFMLM